jgi:predicted Zn-dependent protease
MMNMAGGQKLFNMLKETSNAKADPRIQKYLKEEVTRLIKDLKL